MQGYLGKIKDINIRRVITQLRIGSNKLDTCVARQKDKLENCKSCNLGLETPKHLLTECRAYTEERKTYYSNMQEHDKYFKHYDSSTIFYVTLNLPPRVKTADQAGAISIITNYVNEVYKKRLQLEPG